MAGIVERGSSSTLIWWNHGKWEKANFNGLVIQAQRNVLSIPHDTMQKKFREVRVLPLGD
jgi:hypothetical protein